MDFKEAAEAISRQLARTVLYGEDPSPILERHLRKYYEFGAAAGKKELLEKLNTKGKHHDKETTD